MRPITLTFAGLRSYRSEVTIDFTDLDLFAIIGDTGAGKSTIIEALSLALYGRKTWSGAANQRDLIADGEKTLRVAFTFLADGNEWTVTRSWNRSSTPGINKLVRADGGELIDDSRRVTARITELLGLDHAQFTRTVVIPQGRFDELLRATPAERNKLLTSLLGLDDVRAVGSLADGLIRSWSDAHSRADATRAQLPVDPVAALVDAARRAEEAASRRDRLAAAASSAEELERGLDSIAGARDALDAAVARVPEAGEELADLGRAAEVATQLVGLVAEAEERSVALAAEGAALAARQAELLAGFTKADGPRLAADRLGRAAERLVELAEDRDRGMARLAGLRADEPATEVPPDLADAAVAAATALATAEGAAREADAAVAHARQALAVLRPAVERVRVARDRVAAAEISVAEQDARRTSAERVAAESERALAEATAAEAAARAADLVATVAGHCAPGDPCPICARDLPATFAAPVSPDLDRARDALAVAAGNAQQSTTALAAVTRDHDRAVADHDRAVADLAREVAARHEAAEQLAATGAVVPSALGVGADADTGGDGDGDGALEPEVVLGPLLEAASLAADALVRARADASEADRALATARGTITAAVEQHARAVVDAEAALATTEAQIDKESDVAARLPEALRPPEPITADGLRTAADACEEIAVALEEVALAVSRIQDARHEAERELDRIDARMQSEVVRPSERGRDGLGHRARAVEVVARLVREQSASPGSAPPAGVALATDPVDTAVLDLPPDRPVHGGRAEAAAVAESVAALVAFGAVAQARADDVLAAATAQSDSLVGRLTVETETLAQVLREASDLIGPDAEAGSGSATPLTVAGLHDAAGAARVEAATAERVRAEAEAAVAEAERLDAFLAVARPFLANLGVLVEAVRDRHFTGHLVQARETALIAEASRRLRAITDERFGFVADFGIVTIASGEVRTPDTLSGGERFQAALALALALVEIASRGSGKLEAVFVDEGFGSLDAAALDMALATLGTVAGGGKTVALISHLRPVAEYVDTVLHVTKSDVLGSRIERLDAEARDRLLADDVRSGLTS